MKTVVVTQYGDPADHVRCIDVADVGTPGDDEVVFDVLAFPINPADVSFCRGRYRLRPALPATPGAECVGRVIAIGRLVCDVVVGDLVINLDRENWTQRRRVNARRVVVIPQDIDIYQAAMMRINPPTAQLLLTDVIRLRAGDWIIQNAANSAVGRLVTAFAGDRGINVVNVVRRDEARRQLLDSGGSFCVTDDADLATTVKSLTQGESIRLGIDAVAGTATDRIASCVANEGVVCTYGSLSGEAISISPAHFVYRGLSLNGFLLGRYLDAKPELEIRTIYREIACRLVNGLKADIERVYSIEEIGQAIAHASRVREAGKILVAPNR